MLMPNRTNYSFCHLSLHKLSSLRRLSEYQLKPYLGKPNIPLFLPFFFSSFLIFYYLFLILDTGMSREPFGGDLALRLFIRCCGIVVVVNIWRRVKRRIR